MHKALIVMIVVATAVAASSLSPQDAAEATTGGNLQIQVPPSTPVGTTFDVKLVQTTVAPSPYSGYQFGLLYDSAVFGPLLPSAGSNDATGLGVAPACSFVDLSGPFPGLPASFHIFRINCSSTDSSSTTAAQQLAHVTFTAPAIGGAFLHMIVPAEGGAATGTSTRDAGVQTNSYDCGPLAQYAGGNCGPFPVPPFAAPGTTTTTVISFMPDLILTKTSSVSPIEVGQNETFSISMVNQSFFDATGVTLADNLPAAFGGTITFDGPDAGSCSNVGQAITCAVGTFGGWATFAVDIHVAATSASSPPHQNCASVSLNEVDANTANNVACAPAEAFVPIPNVGVSVSSSAAPTEVGSPQSYTITVNNPTNGEATGVSVTDTVPSQFGSLSLSGPGSGACTLIGQTVTCAIGTLPATSSFTVNIDAQAVTESAPGATNCADVTLNEPDPDLVNNHGCASAETYVFTPLSGFWTGSYTLGASTFACSGNVTQPTHFTASGQISCTNGLFGTANSNIDQVAKTGAGNGSWTTSNGSLVTTVASGGFDAFGLSASGTWSCGSGCFAFGTWEGTRVLEPTVTEEIASASGGTITTSLGDVIDIPPGALQSDSEISATVQPLPFPAPPNTLPLKTAYRFEPSMTFNTPVSVAFKYSLDDLPFGASPNSLVVYRYNTGASSWEPIPGPYVVDTNAMTITAELTSFSEYALFTPDGDADGWVDAADNCPTIANGLAESDDAGIGDQTDNDASPGVFGGLQAWLVDGAGAEAATTGGDACDANDDNDRCADSSELLVNPTRDAANPWDFADMWTPALPASGAPTGGRNGAISLVDVSAALVWVGRVNDGPSGADGRDYDSDTNTNGVEDGAEYDRSPGPVLGVSGPPSGAVSLQDVSVVLAQVGDVCL